MIANGYPPWQAAGTEISTAAVATSLAGAGHDVTVACAGHWDRGPRPLNGVETSERDGVSVVRLHLNWRRGPDPNRRLFDNPLTGTAIGELIDRLAPDVVHVTSCYTLSASVLRAARARNLPLVVTLTDYWFVCPRVTLLRSDGTCCSGRTTASECLVCMLSDAPAYARLRDRLPAGHVRLLAKAARHPRLSSLPGLRGRALDFEARKPLLLELLTAADVILAPTRSLAARYLEAGLAREIRLWPFGHDLGWAARVERRRRTNAFVFGYVGRIAEEKGVHVLVEAASRLAGLAPGAVVEIWGDPAQEGGYTARCMALPAGGVPVRFRGPFGRDRLAEVYGQIDVLVVPSIWDENSPLVVHEAFAAGVPVIASDVGGLREVVPDGTAGLLFPPGDAGALAEAMARIARDTALFAGLRSGVEPVRSADEAAAELLDVYRDLISRRP